jgi:hypothetical protein
MHPTHQPVRPGHPVRPARPMPNPGRVDGSDAERAEPVIVIAPALGSYTLTRVQAANGREYAEMRLSIPLPGGTTAARAHLAHLLNLLNLFVRHAGPRAHRARRRVIDTPA